MSKKLPAFWVVYSAPGVFSPDMILGLAVLSLRAAAQHQPEWNRIVYTNEAKDMETLLKAGLVEEIRPVERHSAHLLTKCQALIDMHRRHEKWAFCDADLILKKHVPDEWFEEFWLQPYAVDHSQPRPYLKMSDYPGIAAMVKPFCPELEEWACSCLMSGAGAPEEWYTHIAKLISRIDWPPTFNDEHVLSHAHHLCCGKPLPVRHEFVTMRENEFYRHYTTHKMVAVKENLGLIEQVLQRHLHLNE